MAKKSLPKFETLSSNYPTGKPDDVRKLVGGQVDDPKLVTNTCVVRVSRAFNYSGDPIMRSTGLYTLEGSDKKIYALRVREFRKYMEKHYGPPDIEHTNSGNGGPTPDKFKNKKGVIMFDVKVWSDATGHFTLWDGASCADECHFKVAKAILLWLTPVVTTPTALLTGSAYRLTASQTEAMKVERDA